MRMKRFIYPMLMTLFMSIAYMSPASASKGGDGDGGGQVNRPDNSYVTVPDGACVNIAVEGIDITKCTESTAPAQSGITSWICPPVTDADGNIIVYCASLTVEDDEDG